METKEILEMGVLEAAEKERNETEAQILTLGEWKGGIMRHNKMQDRPSVTIKIKKQEME